MRSNGAIWWAAVLGVVTGAFAAHRNAGACSCDSPSWTVRLAQDSPDGNHEGVWPATAQLIAWPGTVTILANDTNPTAQIDYLRAGNP